MKKVQSFALSFCLVAGFSAFSVQAETISEALKQCGQVQNSLKRLVCYDGVVNQLNQYGGIQELMNVPAPLPAASNRNAVSAPLAQTLVSPAATAPKADRQSTEASEFGMENRAAEDRLEKIYAQVVSIAKDARKKRVFTLDNGQVWRDTEGSSLTIKEGQTIYIERGAIGSFHMSRDSVNRRFRVKRVK